MTRLMIGQVTRYVLVGLAQISFDSLLFALLFSLGVDAALANIASRLAGIPLNFYLHGRFTFASGDGAVLGSRRFSRYVVLWALMTFASTGLIAFADQLLPSKWVYLSKPLIELALAAISFVVARQWVYR